MVAIVMRDITERVIELRNCFFKNFTTVAAFASSLGVSVDFARAIISEGSRLEQLTLTQQQKENSHVHIHNESHPQGRSISPCNCASEQCRSS